MGEWKSVCRYSHFLKHGRNLQNNTSHPSPKTTHSHHRSIATVSITTWRIEEIASE